MTFEELKAREDLKVKDWFDCKVSYPFKASSNWRKEFDIVKESEKAVLIEICIESRDGEWDGLSNVWVPKSCFESLEEYEKNEQEKEKRFEEGCKKYEQLIAFCKDNGIKGVRNGMRKETILNKILNLGLVYQY